MKHSDLEVNIKSRDRAVTIALTQYDLFKDKCAKHDVIVVVDFTEPSWRKRLHIVNLETSVIHSHHVAHGSNSSKPNNKGYAVTFSNRPESHCSSLGAMITDETYIGKHGYSCKLRGLEKGINDNVYGRSIVIHSAPYVTDSYIMKMGRAGCSYGCFALDPAVADNVIDLVKGGCLLYAYYS